MEIIQTTLESVGKILLFMLISIIFLPAWLIVSWLQEPWGKQFDSLFS